MGDRKRASRVPREQRERFASELKRIRKQRGWRQKDLAEAMGINSDAISGWETMRTFPTPAYASLLADALDFPKLADLGMFKTTCNGPDCDLEAVFNPKGGHDAGLVAYCSVECYRARWWIERKRQPDYKQKRDDSKKVLSNRLRQVRADRDHLRQLIRENCESCAGLGQPCPLIEGCAFIPVTHLLSNTDRLKMRRGRV